jgi:hypothetical protein
MTLGQVRTIVAGSALAGAVLFAFDPAATWWFPSCPLNALTGWLCPFCGSLRALHAILHGAFASAWVFNPLTTLAFATGAAAFALDMIGAAGAAYSRRLLALCLSARGLAVLTAFGVLRNLPDPSGWLTR